MGAVVKVVGAVYVVVAVTGVAAVEKVNGAAYVGAYLTGAA